MKKTLKDQIADLNQVVSTQTKILQAFAGSLKRAHEQIIEMRADMAREGIGSAGGSTLIVPPKDEFDLGAHDFEELHRQMHGVDVSKLKVN